MNEKKEPILRAENISISFGGLQALDGVSLVIYPGEILASSAPMAPERRPCSTL
jgi:ABC-type sugar transport system ATPase subunit